MRLQNSQSAERRATRVSSAVVATVGGIAVAASIAFTGASAQDQRPAGGCERHEAAAWLDFWLGTWDVFVADQKVGVNTITKIVGGCAVTEEWRDARGGTGFSLFHLSQESGRWRQTWVTSTALAPGGTKEKEFVARYDDGAIRFQGRVRTPDGVILDRTTLTPMDGGRVRQVIERSSDGGNTWATGFDAIYQRAGGGAPE